MTITLAILGLIALAGLFKGAQFVARRRRPVQVPGDPEIEAMNARAELTGHVHRCRLCGVEFRHRTKGRVNVSGRECTRCANELRDSFWMGSAVGAVIGGAGTALLFIFLAS